MGSKSPACEGPVTPEAGVEHHAAAPVAIAAVKGASTGVEEVRFVLFGRDAFEAFTRALGR